MSNFKFQIFPRKGSMTNVFLSRGRGIKGEGKISKSQKISNFSPLPNPLRPEREKIILEIPPLQIGQSLVELLITIGIAALIFPALMTSLVASRNGKAQENQRTQAIALLKQTQEIVRVIRENSWAPFATASVNTLYHPTVSGNTWLLATGSDTINGLTRQIVINDVYRNNGIIVTSGGTIDLATKQIVTTISWNSPIASSVTATQFVTRYANQAYLETTQKDFLNGATQSGSLAITNSNGGEISLGAGSGSGNDWCQPGNSVLAKADLPGSGVVQSISATTSATLDYTYSTTGGNASGDSVDEASINHNPTPTIVSNPPVANNNEAKAYGIYVDHAGGYVYFNENRPPNHTIRITNANTLADVGYYDSSGGGTGNSVFVLGTIGYTIVGNTLYTFDIGTIKGTSSQTELGNVTLSAAGNKVTVVRNPISGILYAYVAEASTTKQLEIFQVNANGSIVSPAVANAQIVNAQQGQDVFVNTADTRAYLVTNQYTAGQNQFFIINTQTKSGTLPAPVGSFNTYSAALNAGMNPKGVSVVTGNRAIVVGSGGQQYQVYNIAQENNVKYCGGLTLTNGFNINAISSLYRTDQTAYSYILTTDTSHELQVIQGGNGATFSLGGGTFESQTFTATTEAMVNSFTTTTAVPSQTTLQFRVAIKHGISNSCSGVTFANTDFVGTDGTSNTYFPSTGGILPASNDGIGYENPGQCLRYRAYFSTGDITQTPELYDISFNYSP